MHGYDVRVAGSEPHPQEPLMTLQGVLKELIPELLQVQVMELIRLPVMPEQERAELPVEIRAEVITVSMQEAKEAVKLNVLKYLNYQL